MKVLKTLWNHVYLFFLFCHFQDIKKYFMSFLGLAINCGITVYGMEKTVIIDQYLKCIALIYFKKFSAV